MKDVNVTALRQNLPNYLALVERGEKVRITVHGRVIAEICPPSPPNDETTAARTRLRNSLVRYDNPFESAVAADEWEMNR
ncbi:putative Prevent-host-death protein [Candidatus Accumulibacter aalborgensis]|uniref:Putative Prevent-host-death protein n=1 Tax=Candidatus Accumulibacter aalborgensis TaxID=1860102 RepID=A0A1A8XWG7_9PROT|nr:type II toxin-antitoxin system prevent-host-death family antitoxin [Candidatus Accumulibacter aalborgensis]SBT09345.1 putative Prevent-host-death protein [Candidatus Accumulibacter aalborgensis]